MKPRVSKPPATVSAKPWWKGAVIYQVYPRSFADSNGDGIGDLPGIVSRLDYLQALGVGALWLSPICRSPNRDNGYDISDYGGIAPEFGTMADFDRLLAEAHARGIRIIFDMVCNHSSDQHPWFLESRASRSHPKRDFYIWREGRDGHEPNNWRAEFGGSAWTFNPATGDYYLGVFSPFQPDLNWENPELRKAVYGVMRGWLDKGVDGFRLDVINFLCKAPGLPDVPMSPEAPAGKRYVNASRYYVNQPGIHAYLQELHREVFAGRDAVALGECHGKTLTPETGWQYVRADRGELDLMFHFDVPHCFTRGQVAAGLRRIGEWQAALRDGGWTTITLNNHDMPRQVSAMGDDRRYRAASAKALATLVLTAPGTPVLYQGEELGMTNVAFPAIEDYRDIATRDLYASAVAEGKRPEEALELVHRQSRDNARTPMQWDGTAQAGFTTGTPWIGVNPNAREINAAAEERDPESVLYWYRRLLRFRRQTPALREGGYRVLPVGEGPIHAFERDLEATVVTVVINWSSDEATAAVPDAWAGRCRHLELGNYGDESRSEAGGIRMRPWEARIYRSECSGAHSA